MSALAASPIFSPLRTPARVGSNAQVRPVGAARSVIGVVGVVAFGSLVGQFVVVCAKTTQTWRANCWKHFADKIALIMIEQGGGRPYPSDD